MSLSLTLTAPAPPPANGDAFTAAMWSVQPSGTSGEVYLNIKTKPTAERQYRRIEARINGGTAFAVVAGLGAQNITGLTNGVSNTVELRTVMRDGSVSGWSDVKSVTPVVDTPTVLTTSTFAAALASATAGQRLWLAVGTYADLSISGKTFDPPLIIRANDPANPPVFPTFTLSNCTGITFRGVKFKWTSGAGDMSYSNPNSISACSYTSFIDTQRIGDIGKNSAESLYVGAPIGRSLLIDASTFGTMILRETANTWCSSLFNFSNASTVYGCTWSNLSEDMSQNQGTQDYLIENNDFKDIAIPTGSGAHVDCFQWQHSNAARISRNVTIRNNRLHTGANTNYSQGFFFGHEDYLTAGKPTYNIPLSNLYVEENTMYSGHSNGIAFYACDAFEATNNTLIRNRAAIAEPGFAESVFNPAIVVNLSVNGLIQNNVAATVPASSGSIVSTGNLTISWESPDSVAAPYGYNTVFKDTNADGQAQVMTGNCPIADIRAKAGALIATGGYGSALVRS